MSGASRLRQKAWISPLISALASEPLVVRVVLAEVKGSAPREAGACMLVSRRTTVGTIGGGSLEWEAISQAREMLVAAAPVAIVRRVVLGTDLGQCCGGRVELWIERFTREDLPLLRVAQEAAEQGAAVLEGVMTDAGVARRIIHTPGTDSTAGQLLEAPRSQGQPRLVRDERGDPRLLERLDDALPPLWLYGAGHVGEAVARIVMDLPLELTWVDSRVELTRESRRAMPDVWYCEDPVAGVASAPPGACYLVMTHSHPLDYSLCGAILDRGDFAWLGLIGSASKAARFRSRLARDGFGRDSIARLICPIGVDGILCKWPAAIAVAVAAQLMQHIGAGAGRTRGRGKKSIAGDCASVDCRSCASLRMADA